MTELNSYGGIVPVKDFDDLEEEYRNRNVFIRDVLKSSGHYQKWIKKHNLPQTDSEGKEASLSTIYFKMYREAEDGSKNCPVSVDIWHWLLDTFERHVSWKEDSSMRYKIVPIISNSFKKFPERTPEDVEAYRSSLQEKMGEIDPETWDFLLKEYLAEPSINSHCIDMINRIAEDYGIEMTINGQPHKVMMIEMKVGR